MTNAEIQEYAKKNMCPTCIHIDECDMTACSRRNALFDAVDVAKNVKKMLIDEASEWLKENASSYWSSEYDTPQRLLIDFKQAMAEE